MKTNSNNTTMIQPLSSTSTSGRKQTGSSSRLVSSSSSILSSSSASASVSVSLSNKKLDTILVDDTMIDDGTTNRRSVLLVNNDTTTTTTTPPRSNTNTNTIEPSPLSVVIPTVSSSSSSSKDHSNNDNNYDEDEDDTSTIIGEASASSATMNSSNHSNGSIHKGPSSCVVTNNNNYNNNNNNKKTKTTKKNPSPVLSKTIHDGVRKINSKSNASSSSSSSSLSETFDWFKPFDKPRRPLSAYNIFFQLQRERILNDFPDTNTTKDQGTNNCTATKSATNNGTTSGSLRTDTLQFTEDDCIRIVSNCHNKNALNDESTMDAAALLAASNKRKHRKSHGKIGFAELARVIAQKWKLVDPTMKVMFEKYSTADKERYRQEITIYNEQMAIRNARINEAAAATSASSSNITSTVPAGQNNDKTTPMKKELPNKIPPTPTSMIESDLDRGDWSRRISDSDDNAMQPYPISSINLMNQGRSFNTPSLPFGSTTNTSSRNNDMLRRTNSNSPMNCFYQPNQLQHEQQRRTSMSAVSGGRTAGAAAVQPFTHDGGSLMTLQHQRRRHSLATLSSAEIENEMFQDDMSRARNMNRVRYQNRTKLLAGGNHPNAPATAGAARWLGGMSSGGTGRRSPQSAVAMSIQKQQLQQQQQQNQNQNRRVFNRAGSFGTILPTYTAPQHDELIHDAYNLADEAYNMAQMALPGPPLNGTDNEGSYMLDDSLQAPSLQGTMNHANNINNRASSRNNSPSNVKSTLHPQTVSAMSNVPIPMSSMNSDTPSQQTFQQQQQQQRQLQQQHHLRQVQLRRLRQKRMLLLRRKLQQEQQMMMMTAASMGIHPDELLLEEEEMMLMESGAMMMMPPPPPPQSAWSNVDPYFDSANTTAGMPMDDEAYLMMQQPLTMDDEDPVPMGSMQDDLNGAFVVDNEMMSLVNGNVPPAARRGGLLQHHHHQQQHRHRMMRMKSMQQQQHLQQMELNETDFQPMYQMENPMVQQKTEPFQQNMNSNNNLTESNETGLRTRNQQHPMYSSMDGMYENMNSSTNGPFPYNDINSNRTLPEQPYFRRNMILDDASSNFPMNHTTSPSNFDEDAHRIVTEYQQLMNE